MIISHVILVLRSFRRAICVAPLHPTGPLVVAFIVRQISFFPSIVIGLHAGFDAAAPPTC